MTKILVLYGDENARRTIGAMLDYQNFSASWASDMENGFHHAIIQSPQLILVDLPIGGITGIELCARLQEAKIRVPRIVLTANNDEIERVLILEMGADDCLAKPFNPRELLARMRAVLRRSEPRPDKKIRFGDVEIEPERRVITRAGKEVKLTPCEYNLLLYFVHNCDRPLTRDVILNSVWGYDSYPHTRTVDAHVVRLRSKFEPDPSVPRHFLTVHGVGYRFLT